MSPNNPSPKTIRVTTFNDEPCRESTAHFIKVFMRELAKSSPSLAKEVDVVTQALSARRDDTSLGLEFCFSSDDSGDLDTVQRALMCAKLTRIGLPVFSKFIDTSPKDDKVVKVKFNMRIAEAIPCFENVRERRIVGVLHN